MKSVIQIADLFTNIKAISLDSSNNNTTTFLGRHTDFCKQRGLQKTIISYIKYSKEKII